MVEVVNMLRATVDGQQPHEMLAWVKACRHLPLFGGPGEEPRSRIIFATDGPFLLNGRSRRRAILARGGGNGNNAGMMPMFLAY